MAPELCRAALALAALSSTNNANAKAPETDANKGRDGVRALLEVWERALCEGGGEGGGAGSGPKKIVRAESVLLVSVGVREEEFEVFGIVDDALGRDGSSEESFVEHDVLSHSPYLHMPSARSFQTRQLKQGPGIILKASSACSYRRVRRRGANGRWASRDFMKMGEEDEDGCGA